MLIQWGGTQPEEATWENLTDHDDKVISTDVRNDTVTSASIKLIHEPNLTSKEDYMI